MAQWSSTGQGPVSEKEPICFGDEQPSQKAAPTRVEQARVGALRPCPSASHATVSSFPLGRGQKPLQPDNPALKIWGTMRTLLPKCLLLFPSPTVSHSRSLCLISSLPGELLAILQGPPQKSPVRKLLFSPPGKMSYTFFSERKFHILFF